MNILNAVMCMGMLHTPSLMNISVNLLKLKAQIELNSISMSKNDPKITKLEKYDVEASIDEVENSEDQSVFKYGFTALSNPKNVRLSIEGIARISGDSMDRDEILNKDENDVPKILTMIYHELFPTFFLLSKNLNVSCPPHTIGAMGSESISETEVLEESNEEIETDVTSEEIPVPVETPPEQTQTPPEQTQTPPEQTQTPPEQTQTPPEQTQNPDLTKPTM